MSTLMAYIYQTLLSLRVRMFFVPEGKETAVFTELNAVGDNFSALLRFFSRFSTLSLKIGGWGSGEKRQSFR